MFFDIYIKKFIIFKEFLTIIILLLFTTSVVLVTMRLKKNFTSIVFIVNLLTTSKLLKSFCDSRKIFICTYLISYSFQTRLGWTKRVQNRVVIIALELVPVLTLNILCNIYVSNFVYIYISSWKKYILQKMYWVHVFSTRLPIYNSIYFKFCARSKG